MKNELAGMTIGALLAVVCGISLEWKYTAVWVILGMILGAIVGSFDSGTKPRKENEVK